jgi:hypothetical protein
MDIISIATKGTLTLSEFRQLPTLIGTFDECQRKAFAQAIAEKLLGRKISNSEVNIVLDALVDLATNYVPGESRFTAALRKRWAA